MDIEEKKQKVERARASSKGSTTLVLVGYRGLTVVQMTQLRKEAKLNGAKVEVMKNTLARIAYGEGVFEGALPMMSGPLAYVESHGPGAAQAVAAFAKIHPKCEIIGGVFEGVVADSLRMREFASLPGRQELLARLAYALSEPPRRLARVLAAVADKGSEDEELVMA